MEWHLPSPALLWFMNVCERKPRQKKNWKEFNLPLAQCLQEDVMVFNGITMIIKSEDFFHAQLKFNIVNRYKIDSWKKKWRFFWFVTLSHLTVGGNYWLFTYAHFKYDCLRFLSVSKLTIDLCSENCQPFFLFI